MYFVFFKFFLVAYLLDCLLYVFICPGGVSVLEIAKGYSVMRIVILRLDNECKLIPGDGLRIVLLLFIAVRKVDHRVKVFLIDSYSLPIGVDGAVQLPLRVVIVALQVPKVRVVKIEALQINYEYIALPCS